MSSDIFNSLQQPISDAKLLVQGYRIVDGFTFEAVTNPGNVFDGIVLHSPADAQPWGRKRHLTGKTLQEQITYVNCHGIEKACLIADDIRFLNHCPSLKHLCVLPSKEAESFDFSPLYTHPEILSLLCATDYGPYEDKHAFVDYSRINGLEALQVHSECGLNYHRVPTLKTLSISVHNYYDLQDMFCSTQLDTLEITTSKIRTLAGIEQSPKMQCLYLQYNRSLHDITDLYNVRSSLRALRIQNCAKIKDFSVLSELYNLEYLYLEGSNQLSNLSFLETMPKLKTFILGMEVLDGNLQPCMNLSYVYCSKAKKYYALKDADLPKGEFFRGNDNIPSWRRIT